MTFCPRFTHFGGIFQNHKHSVFFVLFLATAVMIACCFIFFNTFFFDPFNTFAILPQSLPCFTLGWGKVCKTLLHTVLPSAFKLATVRPNEDTVPFFFIVKVVSLIRTPIRPVEGTLALHLIIDPGSVVAPSIRPSVRSLSLYIILVEVANIGVPIWPRKLPLSLFLPVDVVSFIFWAINPNLDSEAVLLIESPLTFVSRSSTIHIDPVSVRPVLHPVTLVNVSVCVYYSTSTMSFIITPPPFINWAIRPNLLAPSFSNHGTNTPLASVLRKVIHQGFRPRLELFLVDTAS